MFSLASLLLLGILSLPALYSTRHTAWHSMELLLLPWGRAMHLPPRLKLWYTPVSTY
jgi:hypothetical protein